MGRDELKKAEPGGFIEYGEKQLPKIDSMRRDKSLPNFHGVPILSDAAVMFTTSSELGDKPASCYTCEQQQSDRTCYYLGPGVKVEKVIGSRESGDPIEYWPCCGMQNHGNPQTGSPSYSEYLSTPQELGLVWINASKPGQKYGGANCGGVNGGDDCDHYIVRGAKEKWDSPNGFCRVLQHDVSGGDVCAAWHDDDELQYPEAQLLIRGDSVDTIHKKRLAKSIVGKEE